MKSRVWVLLNFVGEVLGFMRSGKICRSKRLTGNRILLYGQGGEA